MYPDVHALQTSRNGHSDMGGVSGVAGDMGLMGAKSMSIMVASLIAFFTTLIAVGSRWEAQLTRFNMGGEGDGEED